MNFKVAAPGKIEHLKKSLEIGISEKCKVRYNEVDITKVAVDAS
jgi:hypothetical protein